MFSMRITVLSTTKPITPDALAVSPAATLDLPAGKYRIVSVGNYCDKTVVAGLTEDQVCHLESVLLGHPCAFNGGEITGNDSLYMAITDVEIPPTGATADTAGSPRRTMTCM